MMLSPGAVAPTKLTEARLTVHYAAQIVAGVGRTLIPAREDDSHTSLHWVEALGALSSGSADGRAAAIDVAGLRLLVLDDAGQLRDATKLDGLSVTEASRWLGGKLGIAAFDPAPYELPPHPLAQRAAFSRSDEKAFAELAIWYGGAAALLSEVQAREPGASPVRCWPHHFDIATLIDLGGGRSIGAGLSPGDDSYQQPYWYVLPWPKPDPAALPALSPGHWHTEGFTAAVMTGTEAIAAPQPQDRSRDFLSAAIAACRTFLE